MKTHRFKGFVNDLHDFFQYAVTNIVLSYLCALQRVAENYCKIFIDIDLLIIYRVCICSLSTCLLVCQILH